MRSIKYARAHKRVYAYLARLSGGQQFYSVHRADTLRLIRNAVVEYKLGWGFSEYFSGCLSLIYGKSKILPIFYQSREVHGSQAFDKEYLKRCFMEESKNAVRGIATHLRKAEGFINETAELMAWQAVNARAAFKMPARKTKFLSSYLYKMIFVTSALKEELKKYLLLPDRRHVCRYFVLRLLSVAMNLFHIITGSGSMANKNNFVAERLTAGLEKMNLIIYSRIVESKSSRFYPDYLKVKTAVLSSTNSQEGPARAQGICFRNYDHVR